LLEFCSLFRFLSGSIEIWLISFLVVLACMTRSAQIPFSSWLPAAVAAPARTSALVHSSTLVTAGVYLLIRFSPSFGYLLNVVFLLVSGLTVFIAGLGADVEYDLRKIIAPSTLRQLDVMIMTVPVGLSGLAFFFSLVSTGRLHKIYCLNRLETQIILHCFKDSVLTAK
jgi:NADH-ubiquinone oxidoreductase chain 5